MPLRHISVSSAILSGRLNGGARTRGQSRLQILDQLVEGERLHEVMIEARIARAITILRLSPPRQRVQDHVASPRTFAQRARCGVSVHVGHSQVEYRHVRADVLRARQCFTPVLRRERLMPEQFEQRRKACRTVLVVIGDQDAQLRVQLRVG